LSVVKEYNKISNSNNALDARPWSAGRKKDIKPR
jgi:hypothetical protein